jgi:general secretion pathway protein G
MDGVQKIRPMSRGFTLLELLIVIAIMGILASIATPVYIKYVNQARVTICINEIRQIEQEIDLFRDANGRLPDCLDELPGGNRVDPWGTPYQYLNYEATEKETGGGGGSEKEKGGGGSEKEKKVDSDCSSNSDGGGKEKQRKDRFLHPLNTDYDLYSMGADGKTSAPLTAKASHDDIIRANDGQYIGVAANF